MPVSSKRRGKTPRRHTDPPPPERVALTVPEAAELLGISVRHVYRLLDAGRLPRTRMGGAVRISRAAVEQYALTGD